MLKETTGELHNRRDKHHSLLLPAAAPKFGEGHSAVLLRPTAEEAGSGLATRNLFPRLGEVLQGG